MLNELNLPHKDMHFQIDFVLIKWSIRVDRIDKVILNNNYIFFIIKSSDINIYSYLINLNMKSGTYHFDKISRRVEC